MDNNLNNGRESKNTANLRTTDMLSYLNDSIAKDIADFSENSKVRTGFDNIDVQTKLFPGLYVLGAISSLGKTTFMHQMGDQLAEKGNYVLYFSFEQTILELASKSIARKMAQCEKIGFNGAPTSLEIRKNNGFDLNSEAISQYKSYCERIYIVDCSFNTTITDIENSLKDFINQNDVKPIVIIDYLQLICSDPSLHLSQKETVDMNVRILKKIQAENKMIVILVSSLNRQNYLSEIDFESFKESGGIEYTADVIWGLQLHCLEDEDFHKKKDGEKRKVVREAKAKSPRDIDLLCIKNRFGKSSYQCSFEYYPEHDLFIPNMNNIPKELIQALKAEDASETGLNDNHNIDSEKQDSILLDGFDDTDSDESLLDELPEQFLSDE